MKARDLLLYNTADKKVNVSVYFHNGTFWLTQKAMAELFGAERSVVTKHLKNIFITNELDENSVCAKIAHTAVELIKIITSIIKTTKHHQSINH